MNVTLVVVQGKPEGKEIQLKGPKFLVGRGAECHLRPNSELVSRHHSLFTQSGDALRVRDLGSTNGTLVNGQRIQDEVVLKHGDLVQVGPLGFKVILEGAPVAVAPPPVVPAAGTPRPVAAPAAAGQVARLGAKDASESSIEEWLLDDEKRPPADGGSEVYAGDTRTIDMNTTVERAEDQTTKTEVPIPPGAVPETSDEKVVQTEGGSRLKLSAPKQKIEKTREDTSRAAADILRRMMNRRPGPSK